MNPHHDSRLTRLHSTPDAEAFRVLLPDLGASLNNAAVDLSRDCTIERLDAMLARIKGAETSLMHLRQGLKESGL